MVLTLSFLTAAAALSYAMAAKSYVVKNVTTTHVVELLGAADAWHSTFGYFVNRAPNTSAA